MVCHRGFSCFIRIFDFFYHITLRLVWGIYISCDLHFLDLHFSDLHFLDLHFLDLHFLDLHFLDLHFFFFHGLHFLFIFDVLWSFIVFYVVL